MNKSLNETLEDPALLPSDLVAKAKKALSQYIPPTPEQESEWALRLSQDFCSDEVATSIELRG